jgi:hypothetical protein
LSLKTNILEVLIQNAKSILKNFFYESQKGRLRIYPLNSKKASKNG